MNVFRAALALAVLLASTQAAVAQPSLSPADLQKLNHRLNIQLKNVAHNNEQVSVSFEPDKGGLRTIIRIRVRPNYAQQSRTTLSQQFTHYVGIHKGECPASTAAKSVAPPIGGVTAVTNGNATEYVSLPMSALTGHGNVITTMSANGTILNCAAI